MIQVNSIIQKLGFKKKWIPIRKRFFIDNNLDNNRVLVSSGGSNINLNPK